MEASLIGIGASRRRCGLTRYYITCGAVISSVLLSNGDKSSAVDNPGHVMCSCHAGLDLSVVTCKRVKHVSMWAFCHTHHSG